MSKSPYQTDKFSTVRNAGKLAGTTPQLSMTEMRHLPLKYIIISDSTAVNSVDEVVATLPDSHIRITTWHVFIYEKGYVVGAYPDANLVTHMCDNGNWRGDGRKTSISGNSLNQNTLNVMLERTNYEQQFPVEQINALINFLKQTYIKIGPLEVLPLSDVDPKYSTPGPKFPWVAVKGFSKYPQAPEDLSDKIIIKPDDEGIENIQKALQSLGYYLQNGASNKADPATITVMKSFDIHYNEGRCSEYNSPTEITFLGWSLKDVWLLNELTDQEFKLYPCSLYEESDS